MLCCDLRSITEPTTPAEPLLMTPEDLEPADNETSLASTVDRFPSESCKLLGVDEL